MLFIRANLLCFLYFDFIFSFRHTCFHKHFLDHTDSMALRTDERVAFRAATSAEGCAAWFEATRGSRTAGCPAGCSAGCTVRGTLLCTAGWIAFRIAGRSVQLLLSCLCTRLDSEQCLAGCSAFAGCPAVCRTGCQRIHFQFCKLLFSFVV